MKSLGNWKKNCSTIFFDSIEGALLSYRIGVLRTIVLIKWRIMGYADSCWDGQKKQIKIKYPL